MAAYEPEILTSQPVYNVAAQFQRHYICLQGEELNEAMIYIV